MKQGASIDLTYIDSSPVELIVKMKLKLRLKTMNGEQIDDNLPSYMSPCWSWLVISFRSISFVFIPTNEGAKKTKLFNMQKALLFIKLLQMASSLKEKVDQC